MTEYLWCRCQCLIEFVMCTCTGVCLVFFFKQKTAYEMRISDWSSDVCSSDLRRNIVHLAGYSGNLDAAERSAAFREAMQMLAPDLPVRIIEGDFTDESGERLVQQLLADGTEFDAIFAANDKIGRAHV